MKHKSIKILFSTFLLLGISFCVYRIVYPNDFFLSDKPFKKSPKYLVEKSLTHYQIISKEHLTPDLEVLLSEPDFFLEDPQGWIKNNVKRTVSVVQLGESTYFIKRYNFKSLFDYLTKCSFRSSKAYRSFSYAHEFNKAGLRTPKPLALFEKRIGFLWTSTYLIFEYKEGETLEAHFLKERISLEKKEALMKELSEYMVTFYQNKWVHRDFTFRNIWVFEDQLFFLDLDDMHSYAFNNYFFRKKFRRKHLNNLAHEFSIPVEDLKDRFFDYI